MSASPRLPSMALICFTASSKPSPPNCSFSMSSNLLLSERFEQFSRFLQGIRSNCGRIVVQFDRRRAIYQQGASEYSVLPHQILGGRNLSAHFVLVRCRRATSLPVEFVLLPEQLLSTNPVPTAAEARRKSRRVFTNSTMSPPICYRTSQGKRGSVGLTMPM